MNFDGTIGFTMAGSSLSHVFGTCYAEYTVNKIMTGHAY